MVALVLFVVSILTVSTFAITIIIIIIIISLIFIFFCIYLLFVCVFYIIYHLLFVIMILIILTLKYQSIFNAPGVPGRRLRRGHPLIGIFRAPYLGALIVSLHVLILPCLAKSLLYHRGSALVLCWLLPYQRAQRRLDAPKEGCPPQHKRRQHNHFTIIIIITITMYYNIHYDYNF